MDVYGEENIRMGIHEPRKRFWMKGVVKDQLERGEMPKFRYTITNACLYHLVDGEGETTLTRKKGKRKNDLTATIKIARSDRERTVTVYKKDGNVLCTMLARTVAPMYEDGVSPIFTGTWRSIWRSRSSCRRNPKRRNRICDE